MASDDNQARDKYRDNDDERGAVAGRDRNEGRSDSKAEARGDARDDVGNVAGSGDVPHAGGEREDRQSRADGAQDDYDRDLARDNQRGREASGMSALAADTRAGMAGSAGIEGDFGEGGLQHSRKGQAESPAERGHNEPERHVQGHGRRPER